MNKCLGVTTAVLETLNYLARTDSAVNVEPSVWSDNVLNIKYY